MERHHLQQHRETLKRAKRLLFLAPHPFFQERGSPIADLEVVKVLTDRGYAIDLVTYHEGEDIDVPGCTIHRIPRLPGVRDVQPGFSFKAVLCDAALTAKSFALARRNRYDVVHAVEEAAFVAVALKWSFGIPFVYDMDSSLPDQMADQLAVGPLLRSPLERCEAFAVRRACGVLTMCRSLEEHVSRLDPETPVGRAEDVPVRGDASGTERLAETIGGVTGPILLYVGNLMKYQGIDLLIEAFEVTASEHPDAHLVLVGGSDASRRRYEDMARQRGLAKRVHLVGPRPARQLRWYLSQATVLVSPRDRGENTPMKIYSYMESGVPIVATRLSTHTQVLTDDVAVLCQPRPDSMAEGLNRLLESPSERDRLARAAKELVDREYNAQAFARKVNAFYDRVEHCISGNGTRPMSRRAKSEATEIDQRAFRGV